MNTKKSLFEKRKLKNRLSIKRNIGNRLRLSVFRSNKHIYCQIIDDVKQVTLCSSSTLDTDVKKGLKGSGTIDAAEKVGKDIAVKAKKNGFETVVFDRGGYLYHGRVKSLAESARSNGLKF
ncbi:50S ribosomal protein L18 [Alphaproteobacteria bacterium]|nr:50S ribosomal protein L18 [Alphaproteobacteria bacterium]